MALDAGIISSIIDGATSITGSFLQFGAAVNAANHMQGPEGDTVNYTIGLPDNTQQKQQGNLQIILIIAVILMILVIAIIAILKFM